MIQRTHINKLSTMVDTETSIVGFVQSLRDQGNLKFLNIRDITGIIQIVVLKNNEQPFGICKNIATESVVKIDGLVKSAPKAPGGIEIEAYNIEVLSMSDPVLPIPVVEEKFGGETDLPKRLDYRWIDLRKQSNTNIFKVWTQLEKGVREHFLNNGYMQFYSPSLMSAASEGGSEFFKVIYFEREAFLAQSPQFYKQMAMASGFERVFAVGPVFRAEPSFTTRHLTEFTGWDFEISYIDSHHDVMDQEELMLISGFKNVKETLMPDLEVPKQGFPRISMLEAKEKLKAIGVTGEKEHDLSPEEERALSKIIKDETGHDFVFVTDYHISVRPFYHMRHVDNPELTKSFDLLYKGIEITTGAQREHRPDILEKQAVEKGVDPESIRDYLSFFKYGCPPHGGVGIGPGRIVMQLLDLISINEATYLPRNVKRLTP